MEYYLERSDGKRIAIPTNTGKRLLAIPADGDPVLDDPIVDPVTGKIQEDLMPSPIALNTSDPRAGPGVEAPIGTEGYTNETPIRFFKKFTESDTGWEQGFYTTNGQFVANVALAESSQQVLDRNVLGVSGLSLAVGDGVSNGGRLVSFQDQSSTPVGMVRVDTLGQSGDLRIKLGGGATGVAVSVNGSAAVYEDTASSGWIEFSLTPVSTNVPATYLIWPATSATSGIIGSIVGVSNMLTSSEDMRLDLSQVTLSELDISVDSRNVGISVSKDTSLTIVNILSQTTLKYIDLGNLSSGAVYLNIYECPNLSRLVAPGSTHITEGDFYGNAAMTTDTLFEFFSSLGTPTNPGVFYGSATGFELTGAGEPGLLDGVAHTADEVWNASGTGIANVKGYSLSVSGGTLNADGTIS